MAKPIKKTAIKSAAKTAIPFGWATAIGIGTSERFISGMLNRSNSLELQKNSQDFQEYMSSTNYQRQVKDLQAAGLNPIYAAQGGYNAAAVSQAPQHEMLKKYIIGKKWTNNK